MSYDRDNIRFNTLRNALYHSARRRYYEWWNRLFNFAVVLLGTAAIADAMSAVGWGTAWIGAAVATVGAAQLVCDFGRQARDQQSLQRDYYSLLADIEASPNAEDIECAEWYSRMMRITAEEPPVLRALDAKAYNDALDASIGFDSGERLVIPWHHRVLGGVVAFEGHNYRKMSEIEG